LSNCVSPNIIKFYCCHFPKGAKMSKSSKTPSGPRKSRDYIHIKCQEATTIDGPEFEMIANPLNGMLRTVCANCDDDFPLQEFVWADSNECITDYYDRYLKRATSFQCHLASRTGLYTQCGMVALFFAMIGLAIKREPAYIMGWVIAGVIIGIILNVFVISPIITRQIFGTDDCRSLT